MFFPRLLVFAISMVIYYSKDDEDARWRDAALKKAEKILSPESCDKNAEHHHCILNSLTFNAAQEFIIKCFDEFRNLSKKGKKNYMREKLKNCIILRTAKHKNYRYNWTIGIIPKLVIKSVIGIYICISQIFLYHYM